MIWYQLEDCTSLAFCSFTIPDSSASFLQIHSVLLHHTDFVKKKKKKSMYFENPFHTNSACQAHKHNKLRRQQWKKSPASVHGLQTATSISVKTNSSKPLSLEHGLRVWRDVRKKDKNSQGLLRVSLTTLHFHKEKCPNIFKWAGR